MKTMKMVSWLFFALALGTLAGCTKSDQGSTTTEPKAPDAKVIKAFDKLLDHASADAKGSASTDTAKSAGKKLTIGVMPKLVGIDYFNAVEKGAKEAGAELGINVVYNGPVKSDVAQQAQMIETWIAQKFDVIAVAPNDPDAIAPTLAKARQRGIKVITFDADSKPETRDYFVNQATAEAIAKSLMDVMAKNIGEQGKYLILTGSLTADNQNSWMAAMEKYRQASHPQMVNLSPGDPKSSGEDQAMATQVIKDNLKAYPGVQGIFAITSVALPGAAVALEQENAYGKVFLTGLSSPNSMRDYVKKGVLKEFVLWSPVDLGYLTVQVAKAVAEGTLKPGVTEINAGRLKTKEIKGDTVLLGEPLVFNGQNIDQYNF